MSGRITLKMTTQDMLMAMSEGNPGALRVCIEMMQQTDQIDPDAAFGGLSWVLHMDTLGIYGPRIWMLYKDVCGERLDRMLALIRAHQLGQLADVTSHNLNHAIDNRGEGVDLEAVMDAVRDRLPNFNPVESTAA